VPFFNILSSSISADDGFTEKVMNDLASRAKNMGSNDITFFTVPFTGTGRSEDGQSTVVLDFPKLKSLMAAVQADAVGDYVAANSSSLDMLKPVTS